MDAARHILKTLLDEYHAEGITVKIERDADLSYPSVLFHQGAHGFIFKRGPEVIDLLFDMNKVQQLIAESKAKEDLERKAWQLEQAGYTVTPPKVEPTN
jgi:hypothetical protein